MKAEDMPLLPKRNLQLPDRCVKDMKLGEKTVLMKSFAVRVDENHRAWINSDSTLMEGVVALAGLSVEVERTDAGFILWLDKKTTFKPEKISPGQQWFPVVEFREVE